jgi:hypothetical protein
MNSWNNYSTTKRNTHSSKKLGIDIPSRIDNVFQKKKKLFFFYFRVKYVTAP